VQRQHGRTLAASAVDLTPHIDTSDQPPPGPAQPTVRPTPHHERPKKPPALTPAPWREPDPVNRPSTTSGIRHDRADHAHL